MLAFTSFGGSAVSYQTKNFESATTETDHENFEMMAISRPASRKGGDQTARFFAKGTGTGVGKLRVVLLKGGVPIWYDDATLTPSAVAAGGSKKVFDVLFSKTKSDKIDLLGNRLSGNGGSPSYSASLTSDACIWAFTVIDMGGSTDIEISTATAVDI